MEMNAKLLASDLDDRGFPTAKATGKLEDLDAVLKETLRLYVPLPASEPRCLPADNFASLMGFKFRRER
jgi:hypothetical protein